MRPRGSLTRWPSSWCRSVVAINGTEAANNFVYTEKYVRQCAGWKLAVLHFTILPAPEDEPVLRGRSGRIDMRERIPTDGRTGRV